MKILLAIAPDTLDTRLLQSLESAASHLDIANDETEFGRKIWAEQFDCALVSEAGFANLAQHAPKLQVPFIWLTTDPAVTADWSGEVARLNIDRVTPAILREAIPLLLECREARKELADTPFEKRDLDREIANVLTWYYRSAMATRGSESQSLRQHAPHEFDKLVDDMAAVLEQTINERVFKTQLESPAALNDIAQRICNLSGSPRDVIELYAALLRLKGSSAIASKTRLMTDLCRSVTLELMGHLVTHYRTASRLAIQGYEST